jgi:hypothetical protein
MDTRNQPIIEDITRSAADTELCRTIIRGAAPSFLNSWAGSNPFKRLAAWLVSRSITKSFALQEEKLSPPENINEVSDETRENFRRFIEAVDFGELKEALDRSSARSGPYIKMIYEELWRYPAKVVCILSMLPALSNTALIGLRETAAPLNRMAPDLLADVVISLIKDVDAKEISSVVNELAELVRKLHTGSALIGEPGRPALPELFEKISIEVTGSIDLPLFLKASLMLAEIRGQFDRAISGAVNSNPDLMKEKLTKEFRKTASAAASFESTLDAVERGFSDDELEALITTGLAEIDFQELAFTVSRLCELINRAYEINPDLIKGLLSQFFSSLDSFETAQTVGLITADVVESVRPAAPALLPPILKGIGDIISSARAENPGEMGEALDYLSRSLKEKGAGHE